MLGDTRGCDRLKGLDSTEQIQAAVAARLEEAKGRQARDEVQSSKELSRKADETDIEKMRREIAAVEAEIAKQEEEREKWFEKQRPTFDLVDGQEALEGGDFVSARRLFQSSCDAGLAVSCAKLAFLLENGKGGPQDMPGARVRYDEACRGRDIAGCFALGNMLAQGRGGPRDPARARELFDKACAGSPPPPLDRECKMVQAE